MEITATSYQIELVTSYGKMRSPHQVSAEDMRAPLDQRSASLSLKTLNSVLFCYKALYKQQQSKADQAAIKDLRQKVALQLCSRVETEGLPEKRSSHFWSQKRRLKVLKWAGSSVTRAMIDGFKLTAENTKRACEKAGLTFDEKIKETRTIIRSDSWSSVGPESLKRETALATQMTDRIALALMAMIAAHGSGKSYRVAKTILQFQQGSKAGKENTSANHISVLTGVDSRDEKSKEWTRHAWWNTEFWLHLNRTWVGPEASNLKVDCRLEDVARPALIKAINEVARYPKKLERNFQAWVKTLHTRAKELHDGSQNPEVKKIIAAQLKGFDAVFKPGTTRVDPRFFKMHARLGDTQQLLRDHKWKDLTGEDKAALFSEIREQIFSHPSEGYLNSIVPKSCNRLKAKNPKGNEDVRAVVPEGTEVQVH